MSTLLLADDEPQVLSLVSRLLASQGHTVLTARDGVEALEVLGTHDVDLVILDLVMPRRNGLEVLTDLRKGQGAPPVIVLSAVTDVAVRVEALDRGAVDFVRKPFHSAELMARVRRSLASASASASRQRPDRDDRVLRASGLELDLGRRRARGPTFEVVLSELEIGILAHLMRRTGQVCAKEELLRHVWGREVHQGSNVLEACVRRLRRKLGEPLIETVRGVGYCLPMSGSAVAASAVQVEEGARP